MCCSQMWSPESPAEVEPVADLPLHVGLVGLALVHPKAPLVPGAAGRDDLADLAVVEELHGLQVARLVTALGSRDHGELPGLGGLRRRDHLTHAGGVHRDGLLHEHMLARVDRRLEVDRPEAGRGGQDDQVDVFLGEQLVVAAKAGELALPDLNPPREVLGVVELPKAVLDAVGEQIGQGDDAGARVGFQRVEGGAGAASAAADHADPHGIRPAAGPSGSERGHHHGGQPCGG
jgi:hypothetical protein